jgi:hypothetical protein
MPTIILWARILRYLGRCQVPSNSFLNEEKLMPRRPGIKNHKHVFVAFGGGGQSKTSVVRVNGLGLSHPS